MAKGGSKKGTKHARHGDGYVQLVACAGRIAELEKAGYGPLRIYEALQAERQVAMRYRTFYYNYRGRFLRKARKRAPPTFEEARQGQPALAFVGAPGLTAAQGRGAGPGSGAPRWAPVDPAKQAEKIKQMKRSIATEGGAWTEDQPTAASAPPTTTR